MKRALLGLLALFGLAGSVKAEPTVKMVDPRTIGMTISTISEDGAPLEPVQAAAPGQLVFHEDDWRQIEFFPVARLAEVKRTLGELKAFETAHRNGAGWSDLYLRKMGPGPVIAGPTALENLAADLSAEKGLPAVLFYGQNHIVGQVAGGFTLPLGEGAWLYGMRDGKGIAVLGAYLRDADDMLLTRTFMTLSTKRQLILVDWKAQVVLTGVASNGQIEVWEPQ